MDVEDSLKKFDFESSNAQGPGKNGTPLDTERVNPISGKVWNDVIRQGWVNLTISDLGYLDNKNKLRTFKIMILREKIRISAKKIQNI